MSGIIVAMAVVVGVGIGIAIRLGIGLLEATVVEAPIGTTLAKAAVTSIAGQAFDLASATVIAGDGSVATALSTAADSGDWGGRGER